MPLHFVMSGALSQNGCPYVSIITSPIVIVTLFSINRTNLSYSIITSHHHWRYRVYAPTRANPPRLSKRLRDTQGGRHSQTSGMVLVFVNYVACHAL